MFLIKCIKLNSLIWFTFLLKVVKKEQSWSVNRLTGVGNANERLLIWHRAPSLTLWITHRSSIIPPWRSVKLQSVPAMGVASLGFQDYMKRKTDNKFLQHSLANGHKWVLTIYSEYRFIPLLVRTVLWNELT